jgi:hypothetical protein
MIPLVTVKSEVPPNNLLVLSMACNWMYFAASQPSKLRLGITCNGIRHMKLV